MAEENGADRDCAHPLDVGTEAAFAGDRDPSVMVSICDADEPNTATSQRFWPRSLGVVPIPGLPTDTRA